MKAHHGLSEPVLKGRGVLSLQTSLCCLQCTCSDGERTAWGSRTPSRVRGDAALRVQSVYREMREAWHAPEMVYHTLFDGVDLSKDIVPSGFAQRKRSSLELVQTLQVSHRGHRGQQRRQTSVAPPLHRRGCRCRGHVYTPAPDGLGFNKILYRGRFASD